MASADGLKIPRLRFGDIPARAVWFGRAQLAAPSCGYAVGSMVGFGIPVRLCRTAAVPAQRQPDLGPRGIRSPTRVRHSRGPHSCRSRASKGRENHDQRRADAPHQRRHCLQHLEITSGDRTMPRIRAVGSERRHPGAHRPHCVPAHQLSGDLSLSTGALPGPPPTLISSKARRRCEMSYPQETATFGTFG